MSRFSMMRAPSSMLSHSTVWMSGLSAIVLASVAASTTWAAGVTDVVDAAEPNDPMDVNIHIVTDMTFSSGLLVRENTQPPADGGAARTVDVREMQYQRQRYVLRPRIDVALFHNLGIFAEVPFVLYEQTQFQFAEGTNAQNSTLARDQAPNPVRTIDGWTETAGSGSGTLVDGKYGFPARPYNAWDFNMGANGSFQGVRLGLDNPIVGLRFAPLDYSRDDTMPSVAVEASYQIPVAPTMDPTKEEPRRASPGAVADGLHRLNVSVAFSKPVASIEPYFVVQTKLAAASAASYTDMLPRQEAGFVAGLEYVPYHRPDVGQRFALDVASFASFFSEGRDYSEVSDVLREVTYTDQYMRLGARGALVFQFSDYATFDLAAAASYDTEHFLTNEDIGTDLDAPGESGFGVVDLSPFSGERNPNFNPVLDTPGRRLKIEESVRFNLLARLVFTF